MMAGSLEGVRIVKKKQARECCGVQVEFGPTGVFLWDEITCDYELSSSELVILKEFCRNADLADDLQDEIRFASFTVAGSQGQDVKNPVYDMRKENQSMLITLKRSLGLPESDEGSAGVGLHVVNQQRDAAKSRWAKTHGAAS